MIIISDTSPIINLAMIGHLPLLQQLYTQLIIPPAVYDEIVVKGAGMPGAQEVQTSAWIIVKPITDQTLVQSLQLTLHWGEAEAIALAVELKATLILLDEHAARQVAAHLGLTYTGLLGVIMEAKHHQLIPLIKPVLEDLRTKAGFHLSPQLYAQVLQVAGE